MPPRSLVLQLSTVVLSAILSSPSVSTAASPEPQSTPVVIRVGGSELNGLMRLWEADFMRDHPGIAFDNKMASGDAAIGTLSAGAADIVANGREPMLTEFLGFAEALGNDGPFQLTVATGSAEKLGRTWAQVVYVNSANPLLRLTMAQLERVFSGARTGGYEGYRWTSSKALPASRTITRWGQLGLAGTWSKRPIHTYGYAPTGMSNFFETIVFHGGTVWAPGYRQYVEASAKQAADHAGTTDAMMDALEHDPNGIAWAGLAHWHGHAHVKTVALGWTTAGPFYQCTRESVSTRRYPLTRSVFIQFNHPPGTTIAPATRAFLEYVLSPRGQEVVARQGEYLALPADFASSELARLGRSPN